MQQNPNLWKAINDYVIACGGNPNSPGNIKKQEAVIMIELELQALLHEDELDSSIKNEF